MTYKSPLNCLNLTFGCRSGTGRLLQTLGPLVLSTKSGSFNISVEELVSQWHYVTLHCLSLVNHTTGGSIGFTHGLQICHGLPYLTDICDSLAHYCACDAPRSVTAGSLLPHLEHGTVCLTNCTDCHHWNNSRKF